MNSLENLATEITLEIVRHLLFSYEPVEDVPSQQQEHDIPQRCLSILRVSKHLSALALDVLYGENFFEMSEYHIFYSRHSSAPHHGPKAIRIAPSTQNTAGMSSAEVYPAESFTLLHAFSIPKPAQNGLKVLTIHASPGTMQHFYDHSPHYLPVILARLRALRSLRFVFNSEQPGNGLRYPINRADTDGAGDDGLESINARRFLHRVDCELAHVREVTVVEDGSTTGVAHAGKEYVKALLQLTAALEERNKAWVEEKRVLTFWGGLVGEESGF